jgi:hypothetical protein
MECIKVNKMKELTTKHKTTEGMEATVKGTAEKSCGEGEIQGTVGKMAWTYVKRLG